MNRILIALNALLVAAVIFLFIKVYSGPATEEIKMPEPIQTQPDVKEEPKAKSVEQVGNAPTGKIAYVDIDRLNEESLEIKDLVAESKRRKNNIESSMESLSQQYQRKVEEFQMSQKAGIATENDLRAKAKEIENLERDAQNKQMQMDDLSMDINDKNMKFQQNVKTFLVKWNNGRYDYILSYSDAVPSLLLGNTSLEITNEVIELLNNEYKQKKGK